MPRKSTLAADQMSIQQLYARAMVRALVLQNYGFDATRASEVRAIGRELYDILRQLHSAGTQLKLG
jgi:hypothetical protein